MDLDSLHAKNPSKNKDKDSGKGAKKGDQKGQQNKDRDIGVTTVAAANEAPASSRSHLHRCGSRSPVAAGPAQGAAMLADKEPCVITDEGESGQTLRVHGRATEVHKPLLSAKTLKKRKSDLYESNRRVC
eukprot:285707-Amphidinium_carterae.1